MPLHGSTSNKKYVQLAAPFMRAESRVNRINVGGPRTWFIYDKRSGKLWGGPYPTEARAWRAVADTVRTNGGSLINHNGPTAIEVVYP
jgi:hypothetical protein